MSYLLQDEGGEETRQLGLSDPRKFVLKPQRDGGGRLGLSAHSISGK